MYEEYTIGELVDEIVTDLGYVADIKKDYYKEWYDVGAASIEAFFDEMSNYQIDAVVTALIAYAKDCYVNERAAHNKAIGIRASLELALSEMYNYLHLNHEELTPEDYAQYDDITDNDEMFSDRLRCLRLNLEEAKKAKFDDE